MSTAEKIKTGLDEIRMLALGTQALIGFQLQGIFQSALAGLPALSKVAQVAGLGLLIACLGALVVPRRPGADRFPAYCRTHTSVRDSFRGLEDRSCRGLAARGGYRHAAHHACGISSDCLCRRRPGGSPADWQLDCDPFNSAAESRAGARYLRGVLASTQVFPFRGMHCRSGIRRTRSGVAGLPTSRSPKRSRARNSTRCKKPIVWNDFRLS
jgi:hypothetical protein